MMSYENNGQAVISADLWAAAENEMLTTKNNKTKKKPIGVPLYHFTYSLSDRKFVNYSVKSVSNLFFQYAVATNEHVPSSYISVQMDNEENNKLDDGFTSNNNNPKTFQSYDVDPLRETILRSGIHIDVDSVGSGTKNDKDFQFIGCSNSQVQRHCYIFRRSRNLEENEAKLLQVLPSLRELEANKGIPKRVKYAGLLFSGITSIVLPKNVIAEEIESKVSNGFDFADGPGLISRKLAHWVKEHLGIKSECPSIFQIRYCGMIQLMDGTTKGYVCKGVLVVDPSNNETYRIQVRKSLMKIEASKEACRLLQGTLGICDYSRPTPGRLGQQQICLLSGTVPRTDLIQLQKEHLECVEKALLDPFAMAWVMAIDRRPHAWKNFHELMLAEFKGAKKQWDEQLPRLYRKCADLLQNRGDRANPKKVQLPLAASRTLFGAVFPELLQSFLSEGECVVLLEDGPLRHNGTTDENFVVVSRSPSYHPGDIRVLRVKQLPEGHPVLGLRNCILFSTEGERPDPDKMGGGDLDGDKYLVIWHPTLLKYTSQLRAITAAKYDDGPLRDISSPSLSEDDWIHYAAMTDNSMLGDVERTFYKLAAKHGVKSAQIEELNTLFSNLVDRHPTSLSAFTKLKHSVAGERTPGACVWEEMAGLQVLCNSFLGEPLHTADPGRLLKSYQQFRKVVGKSSTGHALKVKIDEFSHHFGECMLSAKVTETITAIARLGHYNSDSERVPKFSNGNETGKGVEEEEKEIPERREVKKHEKKILSDFESRAHALFDASIDELVQEMHPLQRTIKEQSARKLATRSKFDEKMALFDSQLQELVILRDNDARRHQVWLGEHDKRRVFLRNQLRQQEAAVAHDRGTLEEIKQQLGGELYQLYARMFLPSSQTAILQKKANIQARLEDGERFIRDLRQQKESAHIEMSREQRLFKRTLDEIEMKRCQVEERIESCREQYSDLINGIKISQLRDVVESLESEVNVLRKTLACSGQHDCQDISLQHRMGEVIEQAKKHKASIQSMFCPFALDRAESAFEDLRTRECGLKLGRGHILREVTKARDSWKSILASDQFTLKQRQDKWESLCRGLERVYTLEQNRLMGFPRGGRRNGPLPVYHKRGELQMHLMSSQALIVTAGTGCGKSTQVPQYIADDFSTYLAEDLSYDGPIRICCTQPRRVAAQKLASRVADEYATSLGELVGFKVGSRGRSRDECVKMSEKTVIEFVTEGLLLFNLARSPDFIQQYDAVIIDEMHERNSEQDLCLSLLRDGLMREKSRRPSFKVVVMSASIDARRFSEYFGNCPTMDCPGKIFPIEEVYMPIEESSTMETQIWSHAIDVLFEQVVVGSSDIVGDVLIFLSGASEIDECVSSIRKRAKGTGDRVVAYPLYSKLDQRSIAAATNPDHRCGLDGEMTAATKKNGVLETPVRKVIVCTNLAETSLTIERVRFVIESGRANKLTYDHNIRCSILKQAFISRASSIQRKGRAGRTDSGTCFYLYSENFHKNKMAEYDPPNVLEECVDRLLLLSLHVCGRSLEDMGLLDTPAQTDILNSKERLKELGFLESELESGKPGTDATLTNDGMVACSLSSLRPESVRMILNGFKKYPHCAKKIMTLAVLMSATDSIIDQTLEVDREDYYTHVYGDHLLALTHFQWFDDAAGNTKNKKLLKQKCKERGLDFRKLSAVQEDVEACHRQLKKQNLIPSVSAKQDTSGIASEECLLRSLISGYFHHIVTCIEPAFGCPHATIRNLSLYLDRDSFLTQTLASKSNDPSFLHDEILAACENETDGVNDLTIADEQVDPCFLLYGRVTTNSNVNKTFMQDASAIEGGWVAEEAPNAWINRVQFDRRLKNNSRIVIKHVGPKILSECKKLGKMSEDQDFFEETKNTCEVEAVIASRERCAVVINGTQTAVGNAKLIIERGVLSIVKQFCQNDQAHNRTTRLRLGVGMVTKSKATVGKTGSKQFHTNFCAFGTNDNCYSPSMNVAHFVMNSKNSTVIVNPIREFSSVVVERALKLVSTVQTITWKKEQRGTYAVRFPSQTSPGGRIPDGLQQCFADLQGNRAFLSVTVDFQCFKQKNEIMVFRFLFLEAQKKSPFWGNLRLEILSGRQDTTVALLRSHEAFLVGPTDVNLAAALKNTVVKLGKKVEFRVVVGNQGKSSFSRYQVRRLTSILAELRQRCPRAMMHVMSATRFQDDEIERNTEFLPDYDFLVPLVKAKALKSIRLFFSALSPKDQKQARDLLNEKLHGEALEMESPPPDAPSGCESKPCVMCRRNVRVAFCKDAKSRPDELEGWNLSLCGCSYCRECFRHGIIETLKDEVYQSARCQCCKRIVLAKDCFQIIVASGPKPTKTGRKETSVFQEEWNQICRLVEANYCKNEQGLILRGTKPGRAVGRARGWATCPDCDVSMVHPPDYKFFYCRNPQCRSKMCTRCYQVATSQNEFDICATDQCQAQDSEE